MLLSVVLLLRSVRDCRYDHFTGRGAHGFWLKSWRAIDPQVGDWLHAGRWDVPIGTEPAPAVENQAELIAPYCVSPVMGLPEPENGQQRIPAGWNAWLRVVSLHPWLSRRMVEGPRGWLNNLPERISIDGAEWLVTACTFDPTRHAWAALSGYETLRGAALDGQSPPARWTLRFETPTLIRGANVAGRVTDLLFPLPDRLLECWRRGWNAYTRFESGHSPLEIDEALVARSRETLRAAAYQLQTRAVMYHYASNHSSKPRVEVPVTGWTGDATFESLDDPAVRALQDLLFRFSFYRGVGYHTTQGLGLTRLLDGSGAERR